MNIVIAIAADNDGLMVMVNVLVSAMAWLSLMPWSVAVFILDDGGDVITDDRISLVTVA